MVHLCYYLNKSKEIGHPRLVKTGYSLMVHLCYYFNKSNEIGHSRLVKTGYSLMVHLCYLNKSKEIGHPRLVKTGYSLMVHLCFLVKVIMLSTVMSARRPNRKRTNSTNSSAAKNYCLNPIFHGGGEAFCPLRFSSASPRVITRGC